MLTLELLNISNTIGDGLFPVELNLFSIMVDTSASLMSKLPYVAILALKHSDFLF